MLLHFVSWQQEVFRRREMAAYDFKGRDDPSNEEFQLHYGIQIGIELI